MILNLKKEKSPKHKPSPSDYLVHPLMLSEQAGPALQEECTGHLLSLITISYDCIFP